MSGAARHRRRRIWPGVTIGLAVMTTGALALAGALDAPSAQESRPAGTEAQKASPQAQPADADQNVVRRAISAVEARNGGADVTDSRCFTVGTDAAPADGESLVVPRQTICPSVNLPGTRQEPQ